MQTGTWNQDHLDRLQAMCDDKGETWDLSDTDRDAIRYALEIIREYREYSEIGNLQNTFTLSPEEFEKFQELLDSPPEPSPKLVRLLRGPSLFEHCGE